MGNMVVDEASYMTIVSNVAARVGIVIPTSSSSDDAVGKKLRAIYPTAIQSVLEALDWEFAVKSTSLIMYSDAEKGYKIPSDYVKFIALGRENEKCEECSCESRSKFNMHVVNGRLRSVGFPNCSGFYQHRTLYYISNNLTNMIMRGEFIDLASLELSIRLGVSTLVSADVITLWQKEYQMKLMEAKSRNAKEFQPAQNTHCPMRIANTFADRNCFTNKWMR